MKHKVVYTDDLSWVEDPNKEIDKIVKKYDQEQEEKRKTKYEIKQDDGTILEVDFENDPDWAFLLEVQDEFYDPNGEFIFDKKVVKNWKYFNVPQDSFQFYMDKAKYILKNHWFYKEEIEYMKQGLHLRKMPYEMLVTVLDNMRFLDRCLDTRLAEYREYLELIYKDKNSFRKVSELTGKAKSSIQVKMKNGIKLFARLLIAKEKFENIGEKMLENAVNMEEYHKELELKEKLELVGKLATDLKTKLDKLNRKKNKKDVG